MQQHVRLAEPEVVLVVEDLVAVDQDRKVAFVGAAVHHRRQHDRVEERLQREHRVPQQGVSRGTRSASSWTFQRPASGSRVPLPVMATGAPLTVPARSRAIPLADRVSEMDSLR